MLSWPRFDVYTNAPEGATWMSAHVLAPANPAGSVATVGAAAGLKPEPHTHPNDQIAIMIKGRMLMEVDGEARVMEAGEFAFVPRNVVHRIQTLDEDAVVLDVFLPPREDIARRLAELQAHTSA